MFGHWNPFPPFILEPAIGYPDPFYHANNLLFKMGIPMQMDLNFRNNLYEMNKPILEDWAISYEQNNFNMMNQIENPISPGINKINIVFKTTAKEKKNIVADFGQTMSDVILLYLKKEGKEKLFRRSSGMFFLYNAKMIDIYDETKVEEFFKDKKNPLIIVNEMQFVLGA